jgi:hypothetical protein
LISELVLRSERGVDVEGVVGDEIEGFGITFRQALEE